MEYWQGVSFSLSKVKIVYIEVPYAKLQSQNREREHIVPAAAMEKLIDKLEVPAQEEAHEVVYVIKP